MKGFAAAALGLLAVALVLQSSTVAALALALSLGGLVGAALRPYF